MFEWYHVLGYALAALGIGFNLGCMLYGRLWKEELRYQHETKLKYQKMIDESLALNDWLREQLVKQHQYPVPLNKPKDFN